MVTTDQFVNMPKWKQEAIADRVAACKQTLARPHVKLSDLKIWKRDDPPELVQFNYNPVQADLHQKLIDYYQPSQAPGVDLSKEFWKVRGMRVNCLKARQQGMSTYWLENYFEMFYNLPYCNIVAVSHRKQSTEALWGRVQQWMKDIRPEQRRPVKYVSRQEIQFADTGSSFLIGTAGMDDLSRSSTVHCALLSETPFYKGGAEDILVGLMGTLPRWGNLVEESTAGGFNSHYHRRAAQKMEPQRYFSCFYSCYDTPEYRETLPTDFVLTPDEVTEMDAYKVDEEQIYWRRNKTIEYKSAGKLEQMAQEFPRSEIEAFVSAGHPYFDVDILTRRSLELQDPKNDPIIGIVMPRDYKEMRNALASGELKIWDTPQDGYDYIVSNDPSGGLTKSDDTDFCSTSVVCVQTWKQVAHLYGKWHERQMAALVAELGWYYNTALVGVLRRNHGGAVLSHLIHDEQYPKQIGRGGSGIYYHDLSQVYDKVSPTQSDMNEPGWDETERGKAHMLDAYKDSLLMEPGIIIMSKITVEQSLTYVHLPGGKAGGEAGSHDDAVSDISLSAALLNLRFERKRKTRELLAAMEKQEPSTAWSGYDRR